MMKWIAKATVTVVALGAFGLAAAQTSGPTGWSARIGGHWPNVGDTNLGLGLDYKFRTVPVEEARGEYLSFLGASVDFYGEDDNWNIPLAVTYNVRANNLLFSAGLGWDFYRHRGKEDSGLGAQLAASYEFGDTAVPGVTPFFVQAKYFFANESDLSGFGIYAGIRF